MVREVEEIVFRVIANIVQPVFGHADTEHVTIPYVSRLIRLAFLPPAVLEQLLVHRRPSTLSIDKLAAALVPRAEQLGVAFEY